MCYSAQIWADYRRYVRAFGAILSVSDFVDLFLRRLDDPRIKIPKAMEAAFAEPVSAPEQTIRDAIDQFNTLEATRLEQQLFAQRKALGRG